MGTPLRFEIYLHTSRTSGKSYVGQTIQTMAQRWKGHVSLSRSKGYKNHFSRAIAKYGPADFDHAILEVCFSQEEANLAEQKWIAYYHTANPANGYNLTEGGGSRRRLQPLSDEGRANISEAQKKRFSKPEEREAARLRTLGQKHSPETIEKMKASNAAYRETPEAKQAYQRLQEVSHTPEVQAKRSQSQSAFYERERERVREAIKANPDASYVELGAMLNHHPHHIGRLAREMGISRVHVSRKPKPT